MSEALPSGTTHGIWRVPFSRHPNFTGHERVLDSLGSAFRSGRPGSRVQVVYGLAGISKTQLAVEYAYRRRGDYRIVSWLRADSPASLAQDFAQLAARLGV